MSSSDCESTNTVMSPTRKRRYISRNEKSTIINIYKQQLTDHPEKKLEEIIVLTARIAGVSKRSVYRIRNEYVETGEVSSPKKTKSRGKITDKVDEFDKHAIRRIIHQFFLRNELPTIKKIMEVVNADCTLPNFKKSTFHTLLKCMNFKFVRRGRDSFLTDRQDIVLWRRDFLRKIKEFRQTNRHIYYLDETWVTAGHTKNKVWKDMDVTSARNAFLSGLLTGLKNPSGKGRRLIITHIGSENGFVDGALWTFESKKTNNYHEEMNAENFEKWFNKILDKIEPNSVIVMDNAPYHSRKIDKIPNSNWKKAEIQQWLESKEIPFLQDMVKQELLQIVKRQDVRPTYALDKMAEEKNVTVLRLPPYHCELNPIEMIWAQIKNYVAERNTTFKFADVKNLFSEAVEHVTTENWKKCVQHVVDVVENKFWQLDQNIDTIVDSFILNVSSDSSETE